MIDTLAEMKIHQFLESWDKIEFCEVHFGKHSVDWHDAYEIFLEHKVELKRLLILGLAKDI